MDLSVHTLFFSPTGGTRKAASLFAHSFSSHVEEHSLEQPVTGFSSDDFVVVALPVFTGRLPAYAREKLKAINGGGAKTVAMTVYGNRDFEDALLELQDLLIEQNFRPVAAIAAVAQHSMMSSLAAHRPDEQDGAQLAEFAQKVAEKLISCDCCNSPCIPGNRPYREPGTNSCYPCHQQKLCSVRTVRCTMPCWSNRPCRPFPHQSDALYPVYALCRNLSNKSKGSAFTGSRKHLGISFPIPGKPSPKSTVSISDMQRFSLENIPF